MGKIFQSDTTAWSAWTRAIEGRLGDPASPFIVQANTVLRPLQLSPDASSEPLNVFRKLLLADSLPSYTQANKNTYVGTGSRASDAFEDFLETLNVIVRSRHPEIDQKAVEKLQKRFNKAAKELRDFLKDARQDWTKAKSKDPGLARQVWEEEYGYRDLHDEVERARDEAYGLYLKAAAPYPDLNRVAKALGLIRDTRQFIRLPMDASELPLGADAWSEFRKTYIDADFPAFLNTTTNDSILINESSSSSTSFESRWSGSASLGYGFFSFGGGASGGTLDKHLRDDAQSVLFKFKNLNRFAINRGPWFSETILRMHCTDVDADDYWGPRGALNLVPLELVFGRGLSVEISTLQRSADEFKNWYTASGSAGFSFGPFSIGGSASSSQSFSNIQNQSSGTMIRIEDLSNTIYLVGVISLKTGDLLTANRDLVAPFLAEARNEALLADNEWETRFPDLAVQTARMR
jgi:hypothetical protein